MTRPILHKLIHISLAGSLLASLGSNDANAQSQLLKEPNNRIELDGVIGEEIITRDGRGTIEAPGPGKIFFPGDHFTQAFPGDHFSPRQISTLTAQGIRTVDQFRRADAATLGRFIGADVRTIRTWQRQIEQNMGER